MADSSGARPSALPPLEERISFLMHRIEARLESICNPYFRRYDVALHNSRMLVMLAEAGATHVGDLVNRMVLPQSTISHQLRELEKRQLIRRSPGIEDSRSVTVQLTARGRRVAQKCNELSATVYRTMVDGLTAGELEQLRAQLRGIYDRLLTLGSAPRNGGGATRNGASASARRKRPAARAETRSGTARRTRRG